MLSVVVVAYKALGALERCLLSLSFLPQDSEVIVVDNASGGEMRELALKFPQFHWIWNEENRGYASAANQGARKARGEFLLFLNPDTQISKGSVEPMLSLLQRGEADATGPLSIYAGGWQNLLYHLPEHRVDSSPAGSTEILRLLAMVYSGQKKSVKLLVGFCLMIRTQLFFELGAMDEELILGLDDLDLSWRMREKSLELAIAMDSYVYHEGQSSFKENPTKKAMEDLSQLALSRKLIAYYGSPAQVPSSWELWDVDWFKLVADTDRMDTMHLRDELGIVLDLCQIPKGAWPQLLQYIHELGLGPQQVLLLGSESVPGYFHLNAKLDAEVWPLITGFLASRVKIMVLRSADLPTAHALQFGLNQAGAWSLSDAQSPFAAQAFFADPQLPLPVELQAWAGPKAWLNEHASDNVEVMKIGTAEIRQLHQKLRSLRQKGQRELLIEFDNSLVLCEGENPYALNGLSFYDVERELNRAGWRVEEMGGDQVHSLPAQSCLEIQRAGRFEWENMLESHARLRLRAQALSEDYDRDALVSFVILALNKMEYTRQCIESIQAHCTQNYELILVDNGSTDGTLEYFKSVPHAKVIHNPQNLGVAAGWNQGIALAEGEFVLIFNNDTLVPPMAIENMVRTARNFPDAGIVAPRSNQIAGPQLLAQFPEFNDLQQLFDYLAETQKSGDLSAWQFPRIKGFCMLIPRSVIEEVGVFDEAFGFGNFEDDDYSLRVHLAGKQLLVADDSIIFHYGSVSFDQAGVDWNEQMVKNHKIFNQKWAKGRLSLGPTEEKQSLDELKSGLNHSATDVPLLLRIAELCVQESRLSEALGYYCQALEYGFSLDVLEPLERMLKTAFSPEESEAAGRYLLTRFPVLEGSLGQAVSAPKMWIEDAEALLRAGNLDAAQRLLATLNPEQKKSFAALNLQGILAYYRDSFDQAFHSFEKALKIQPAHENCLLNFYDAGIRLRQFQKVKDVLERALALDPHLEEVRKHYEELCAKNNFEGLNPENMILLREKNLQIEKLIKEGLWELAEKEILILLKEEGPGERALNNLGLIYWYKGRIEEAWDCFEQSAHLNLLFVDALVNLYDAAIVLGRLDHFLPLFEKALIASPYQPELRELDRHLRMGTLPERLHHYFEQKQYGKVVHSTLADAKAFLEVRDYPRAIACFLKVIEGDGQNADAFNGLGLANWYRSSFEDAFLAFRRAAEITPLDVDVLENLWDAAKACGRQEEIRSVLVNALVVDPSLNRIATLLEGESWT